MEQRFAQIKGGNKLHIIYTLLDNTGTNPLCGQPVPNAGYKKTINMPLGNACKRCIKIRDSVSFNLNEFIKKHL